MNNYRRTFSKRHTFLAVVHVHDTTQAIRNAAVAAHNGADGIFLINHRGTCLQLLEVSESSERRARPRPGPPPRRCNLITVYGPDLERDWDFFVKINKNPCAKTRG